MNQKHKSTLGKFENILKLKNYSENTIQIYMHYVCEFVKSFDKPAIHILAKDVKNYLENYKYSSVSQQNQIYSAIKNFSKYILGFKKLDNIILERPRKEKSLPQVIDKEELKSKIFAIQNKKHKAILALAFSTGMRVSEIINLEIANIDSDRMIILIKNGKGNKDRYVPLSEQILVILREYFAEYKPKQYLFNGQNQLKYSSGSCNNIVKKYIRTNAHFHQLRHSSFTALLESGTDIRIIQKLAGHSSSKTTEIYTHVSNDLLRNISLPI